MHQKRVAYFDLLNICAALAVVFLHCNGNVHVFSDSLAWKQALIIEVCMYLGRPDLFHAFRRKFNGISRKIFHIRLF